MTRYRITISGPNAEAMADLVRKYKIDILGNTVSYNKDTGHAVDAIANTDEIEMLKAAGYKIQCHEDVDEVGKARQKEVGKGNRYMQTTSQKKP